MLQDVLLVLAHPLVQVHIILRRARVNPRVPPNPAQKLSVWQLGLDRPQIFTTEGGLSTAKHRTFVHRRCPYIKIDVDFTLSDPKQSVVDERPTDTVSKMSRPYLEWTISD